MSIDSLFGQVRATVQNQPIQLPELLNLLRQAHQLAPSQYQDQWVPYLSGFPLPLLRAQDEAQLEEFCALYPTNGPIYFTTLKFSDNPTALQHYARINWLRIRFREGLLRDFANMANLGHFKSLNTLELQYGSWNLDKVDLTWLHHIQCPNLHTLSIYNASIYRAILDPLWRSAWLPQLKTLKLQQNALDRHAIKDLCTAPNLHLRYLDLSFNPTAIAGAQYIAQAPSMNQLQHLNLSNTDLSNKGLRALAQNTSLHQLKDLILRNNDLNHKGYQYLQEGSFEHLETLNLQGNTIELKAAKALSKWPSNQLKHINLAYNTIDDQSAQCLAQAPWMKHLHTLNLAHNAIGTKGALALIRHLPKTLRSLNLLDNHIGDQGAKALAQCANLNNLQHLFISTNSMGEAGQKALFESPYLPKHLRQKFEPK